MMIPVRFIVMLPISMEYGDARGMLVVGRARVGVS